MVKALNLAQKLSDTNQKQINIKLIFSYREGHNSQKSKMTAVLSSNISVLLEQMSAFSDTSMKFGINLPFVVLFQQKMLATTTKIQNCGFFSR